MEDQTKNKAPVVGIVHVILSQSYTVFLLAVIFGVIFDIIFPSNIFDGTIFQAIGLVMILLGSILVYWAQKTTSYSKSEMNKERDINFFMKGPYRYMRNPTNFGLTIMALGLGLIISSLFSVIFLVLNYFISKFVFLKEQEDILKERYGNVYEEYTKRVKDWL